MAKTQSAGKRRSRRTRTRSKRKGSRKCAEDGGGSGMLPEPAALDELKNNEEVVAQKGGKRGKKGKKSKKKMNEFFRLLIDAKKNNKESFSYKGKTYKKKVGTKKNPKLVVYKKA
mgnify:CR=1 FL=1